MSVRKLILAAFLVAVGTSSSALANDYPPTRPAYGAAPAVPVGPVANPYIQQAGGGCPTCGGVSGFGSGLAHGLGGCKSCGTQSCGTPLFGLSSRGGCKTCGGSLLHKDKGPYVTNLCPGACFGYFQTQWRKWDEVCPYPYQGTGVTDAPKRPTPALPSIYDRLPVEKKGTLPEPRPIDPKTGIPMLP